jgi:hypothetical protein
MREHVCVRCGEFLLLFPSENIGFIDPVPSSARFCEWTHRERGGRVEPVMDLRRLLGVRSPAPPERGVTLRWRSTDGARRLTVLADAVEAIVNCYAGDLIDVPILPARLRPFCDQVMRDPRGGLRLRVKTDVKLQVERAYVRSLLAMRGVALLSSPERRSP